MTDLFGDEPPPPGKTEVGYLEHLARLNYPDGLRFWSLAPTKIPHGLPAATTEVVWLRDGERWHLAAIDSRDGRILRLHPEKGCPT